MNPTIVTKRVPRVGQVRRGAVVWTVGRYLVVGTVLVSAYIWLEWAGIVDALSGQGSDLQAYFDRFGHAGPLVLIALMTVAVVVSPLPSAPVALAAGALYGHFWGTLYVVIGAQSGAMLAFAIARYLRPDRIRKWLDGLCTFRQYDSQNMLMLAVFASRLVPFVSFDAASYAAGLTPLEMWRFAVATLLGILPASFVLAHFGGEAATGGTAGLAKLFLVFVLLGGSVFVYRVYRRRTGSGS